MHVNMEWCIPELLHVIAFEWGITRSKFTNFTWFVNKRIKQILKKEDRQFSKDKLLVTSKYNTDILLNFLNFG